MAASRSARGTPERRRSQIFFGSLNLTNRPFKHGQHPTSPPARSVNEKRPHSSSSDPSIKIHALLSQSAHPSHYSGIAGGVIDYITDHNLDASDIETVSSHLLTVIQSDADNKAIETAYSLLSVLVRQQPLFRRQRQDILAAVLRADGRGLHRPQILSDLIRDGKDIDGFENDILALIGRVLIDSHLQLCLADGGAEEKPTQPHSPSTNTSSSAHRAFDMSIDLLANTIKFGRSLNIADVPRLSLDWCRIVDSSTPISESVKLLRILDALITYEHISASALQSVMRCLCTIHFKGRDAMQPAVEEKSWQTFQWLLATHLKDLVITRLVQIQELCLMPNGCTIQESEGALQILRKIMTDNRLASTINVDISRVLSSLNTYSLSALDLIGTLAEKEHLRPRLLEERDWTGLSNAIMALSACPMPVGGTSTGNQAGLDHILCNLDTLPGLSYDQRGELQILYLTLAPSLPDVVAEKLLASYDRPLDDAAFTWQMQRLTDGFIRSEDALLKLRLRALDILQTACHEAQWHDWLQGRVCAGLILEALEQGAVDATLQARLVESIAGYEPQTAGDESFFREIVRVLCSVASRAAVEQYRLLQEGEASTSLTSAKHVTSGLVVLLMRSLNKNARRSQILFGALLDVLACPDSDPAALVMLMRGLFRMRSDVEHHIFMMATPEGEDLAAALRRASPMLSPTFATSRRASRQSDVSGPEPVWMYGDIRGLPEDPPVTVSPVLFSRSTPGDASHDSVNMALWLDKVIYILDSAAHWEVYSYVVVHLGAQLTNQSLFTEAIPQIQQLRSLLCKQLMRQSFQKPPDSSELRKADVAVCLYHILTTLIGYLENFSRTETEEMISAFIVGLTAYDRTTVPCLHALTLCCYELPGALKRDLVRIVAQMATIVTKSEAAIHVLEFLAGLSRLTDLARSFHGEEIKIVFGVCFSYIDYARGKRYDEAHRTKSVAAIRPSSVSAAEPTSQLPSSENIAHYVFALAYHVIAFWFLTLREEDRDKHLPWMKQRLLYTEGAGGTEDQALVTLDLLWRARRRYDVDTSMQAPPLVPGPSSPAWVCEYSIITINCDAEAGVATVVERRASGNDAMEIPIGHKYSSPEQIFQGGVSREGEEAPFPTEDWVRLADNDAVNRAMAFLDRTSAVDFFKTGVIYVGENQFREADILSNVMGSPDYNLLLKDLGERLELQGLKHSSAGLDTSEMQTDGPSTIWHRDNLTALVYHVTTFMPTNREMDPACIRKKAHIGNDYVNIVFNNCGKAFAFDTFPSAFNYVYIVVTPEARATFIETRTRTREAGWYENSWFKVQVITREDFPRISSAAETKVVSGKVLAKYVRNLALNACVFCNVWANRGGGGAEYPSSWKSRLQQLRSLRSRYGIAEAATKKRPSTA